MYRPTLIRLSFVALSGLGLYAVGCGGSTNDSSAGKDGGGGSSGSSGSGGSGGSSGAGGASGTGGTQGGTGGTNMPPPMPIKCGDTTCNPVSIVGMSAAPCCT